jgi:hypothetical protein
MSIISGVIRLFYGWPTTYSFLRFPPQRVVFYIGQAYPILLVRRLVKHQVGGSWRLEDGKKKVMESNEE